MTVTTQRTSRSDAEMPADDAEYEYTEDVPVYDEDAALAAAIAATSGATGGEGGGDGTENVEPMAECAPREDQREGEPPRLPGPPEPTSDATADAEMQQSGESGAEQQSGGETQALRRRGKKRAGGNQKRAEKRK